MKSRRLTHADVRRLALSLPDAREGAHMGHADLRVRNKIFASLPNKPGEVVVKCTPANLDMMRRADPLTFRDAWRGRWLAVALDRVSRDTLRGLLEDAWELTAPKTLVAARRNGRRSVRPR